MATRYSLSGRYADWIRGARVVRQPPSRALSQGGMDSVPFDVPVFLHSTPDVAIVIVSSISSPSDLTANTGHPIQLELTPPLSLTETLASLRRRRDQPNDPAGSQLIGPLT